MAFVIQELPTYSGKMHHEESRARCTSGSLTVALKIWSLYLTALKMPLATAQRSMWPFKDMPTKLVVLDDVTSRIMFSRVFHMCSVQSCCHSGRERSGTVNANVLWESGWTLLGCELWYWPAYKSNKGSYFPNGLKIYKDRHKIHNATINSRILEQNSVPE